MSEMWKVEWSQGGWLIYDRQERVVATVPLGRDAAYDIEYELVGHGLGGQPVTFVDQHGYSEVRVV